MSAPGAAGAQAWPALSRLWAPSHLAERPWRR